MPSSGGGRGTSGSGGYGREDWRSNLRPPRRPSQAAFSQWLRSGPVRLGSSAPLPPGGLWVWLCTPAPRQALGVAGPVPFSTSWPSARLKSEPQPQPAGKRCPPLPPPRLPLLTSLLVLSLLLLSASWLSAPEEASTRPDAAWVGCTWWWRQTPSSGQSPGWGSWAGASLHPGLRASASWQVSAAAR